MDGPHSAQMDLEIDRAIARWNKEKQYCILPLSVSYSATSGLATLTFKNRARYQFNPLHV